MLFTDKNTWTIGQLINMSQSLARGYCPGSVELTSGQTIDSDWQTDNIVKYGISLQNGYGFFYF
jgi:hypothetical protein